MMKILVWFLCALFLYNCPLGTIENPNPSEQKDPCVLDYEHKHLNVPV